MRYLYAGLLVTGFGLALAWAIVEAWSGRDEGGRKRLPPLAAGLMAFGLGGLSAAFAGWPGPVHVVAAAASAAAAMAWVRVTRPRSEG